MELKNKTLFITGVGGFIGLRAAEMAMERGMRVSGLEISETNAKKARQIGVKVSIGDITDAQMMKKTVRKSDIVLHTAAIVKEGGSWDLFRRINVEGTRNVAQAAKTNGCRMLVHLSSVMVYGFHYPDRVTEAGPLCGENNPYCQTKIESEDAAFVLNDPPHFGVIVIRPGDVYGPGCIAWVERPLQLMKKRMMVLPDGGQGIMNHVYVDNLIEGIFLAIEKEAYGEAFNLTDDNETTFRTYFNRLADAGQTKRPYTMPSFMLRRTAQALQLLQNNIKFFEIDLNPEAVDYISRPYPYSIDKARRVLGYVPKIGLDEGFQKISKWLESEKVMKTVYIKKYGSSDVLQYGDYPKPVPRADEVLIEVHAAGVNPMDWQLRKGLLKLIPGGKTPFRSFILGRDVSGVIKEVGQRARQFKKGDMVFAMTPTLGGTYAEYVSIKENAVALKPSNMTHEEAATVPLGALTAWQVLVNGAQVRKGQKVLIIGASGGVGTFAVQIAKAFGAVITGICGPTNIKLVKSLGAEHVVDYTKESFNKILSGYDIVFDVVGNESRQSCTSVLKPNGVFVSLFFATHWQSTFNTWTSYCQEVIQPSEQSLWKKTNQLINRSRSLIVQPSGSDLTQISQLIESGNIRSVIDRTYPLDQAAKAHEYSENGHAQGKLVLTMKG